MVRRLGTGSSRHTIVVILSLSKGDLDVPGNTPAMPELPIVLVLRLPPAGSGAIDAEVFGVNATPHSYRVAAASTGFSTIDDEGTLLHHGAKPVQVTLRSGDAGQIGDVVAWEWDGHVGLVIEFSNLETGYACRATYNLKPLTEQPATLCGYVVPPGVINELAAGS